MKKIVYTVCSANHLAHCKTMADSFAAHHPDYSVFIILIDKVNGRFDLNAFKPYNVLEISGLGIFEFEKMANQYSIIELNCAMKPFAAQYLFAQYAPDYLLYIDSDTYVLNNFNWVEMQFNHHDLVITPHFTNPYPDAHLLPRERDILRSGLYNAGFLGMRKSPITQQFLQWWASHMTTECYYNFAEGMGVDQIWLNLVPLLFDRVCIANHPGLNVAYWNLHERHISYLNQQFWVNQDHPLVFLHISGFQFDQPEQLSRHQNRYQLKDHPALAQLFQAYQQKVMDNGYSVYASLSCAYAIAPTKSLGIMKTVNALLKPLGVKISPR